MRTRSIVRMPARLSVLVPLLALALVPALEATPAAAQAAAGSTIVVCGIQASYSPASSSAAGAISIGVGGPTLAIAPGVTFTGIPVGSAQNVCLFGTFNAAGQLASAVLIPNPAPLSGPYLTVCGNVTALTPATASATGSITIGGSTFTVAAGTTFTGATLATGSSSCLSLTLNGTGGITAAVATSTLTAQPFTVCGQVTAFTAATSSTAGTVTIGGAVFPIAAGTTVGGTTLATGSSFCLLVTFNAAGQITAATAAVPLAATPVYSAHLRPHGIGGPIRH